MSENIDTALLSKFYSDRYVTFFAELTKEHDWKTVLEWGTGWGESGLGFTLGGADVISIDSGYAMYGYAIVVNWKLAKDSQKAFGTYDNIDWIKASDEHIPIIPMMWDCIFIDTSHEYERTVTELEIAKDLTYNIILDDVGWDGGKTILKAMNEFVVKHSEWKNVELKQPAGLGIGLLMRNND